MKEKKEKNEREKGEELGYKEDEMKGAGNGDEGDDEGDELWKNN